MRVFDIEKTCLADEFQILADHELTKLKYSPNGNILVGVWKNGAIGIHNVMR